MPRDSRRIPAVAAAILGLAVCSFAPAQEIGGEIGNEYELKILDHEDCPVQILRSAYVRKPELPPHYDPRLTERKRMTTKFSVGVRNQTNRDIESVEVRWLAYGESSNLPLVGRKQLLQKRKALRPGDWVGSIDYGPAETESVHHYEVFVYKVTFVDGTFWKRPPSFLVIPTRKSS